MLYGIYEKGKQNVFVFMTDIPSRPYQLAIYIDKQEADKVCMDMNKDSKRIYEVREY